MLRETKRPFHTTTLSPETARAISIRDWEVSAVSPHVHMIEGTPRMLILLIAWASYEALALPPSRIILLPLRAPSPISKKNQSTVSTMFLFFFWAALFWKKYDMLPRNMQILDSEPETLIDPYIPQVIKKQLIQMNDLICGLTALTSFIYGASFCIDGDLVTGSYANIPDTFILPGKYTYPEGLSLRVFLLLIYRWKGWDICWTRYCW